SGSYYASSLAVADMNGDGILDLAVTNTCSSVGDFGYCLDSTSTVGALVGNGDGTFQPPTNYQTSTSGGFAEAVLVADLNADGKPDLLIADIDPNQNSYVEILINTSSRISTSTALASTPNPSGYGQTVSFTATVAPQGLGTPTGGVTFLDGTTVVGNAS